MGDLKVDYTLVLAHLFVKVPTLGGSKGTFYGLRVNFHLLSV